MNLLLHGGLMMFGNADGQGKLFHGGVMVSQSLNRLEITRVVILSGSGSISASAQKVASRPVQLSGFGDLSLSLIVELIQLYGDILIPTNERLRVHGMVGETLRVHTAIGERLWVSPL